MDSNTLVFRCPRNFSEEPGVIGFQVILILISVVITVVFAFIKKRVNLAPNCCNGRPGIPVPMDFLITPRHRWIYVAIFGVMGVNLFYVFISLFPVDSENVFLWLLLNLIIFPLLIITVMGLYFAPLFLCVDASPFTLLGHVIGLIYSLLWFGFNLAVHIGQYVRSAEVPQCSHSHIAIDIFRDLPHLAVNGIIVFWYLYQVIAGTRKFIRNQNDIISGSQVTTRNSRFSNVCRDYHASRIKVLLRLPKKVSGTQGRVRTLMHKIWKYFVPFDKNFRLPLPFLGAFGAALMLMYQWMFLLATLGLFVVKSFSRIIIPIMNLFFTQNAFPAPSALAINNSIKISFNAGLPAVVALSPILAFITCLVLLLHMVGSVSAMKYLSFLVLALGTAVDLLYFIHGGPIVLFMTYMIMKKAAQGGFSEKLPGVLKRAPSAWKYIGLQIGFCIVAFFIYYLIYLVIGIVIAVVIILFIVPFTRNWMIRVTVIIVVPLIWTKVVFYSQFLICKFFFLSDKDGKFICITNKNVFNCVAYLLFFYNGVAGFVSALVRLGISAGVGLLLLFRLDQNVLTKIFSFLDFGHKAFLGFFYLDYAYNNAVVHVFIQILKESVCKDLSKPMIQNPYEQKDNKMNIYSLTSGNYSQRRIRNRWLVAYTLIRNPSIQCLTGSKLQLVSDEDSKSENLSDTVCGKSFPEVV